MRLFLLLFVIFPCLMPAQSAYNCTACEKRKCQPLLSPCRGNRAIDPCGCCTHCAKQNGEFCGGADWEFGYCDRDYKCASVIGQGLVEIPMAGVCKSLPGYGRAEYFEDDDENCPKQNGCYRAMGHCDCITKHTCILDFFQYSALYCDPRFDDPSYDGLFEYPCTRSGCDIVDKECVCSSGGCDRTYEFSDGNKCYQALKERLCTNVTCPKPEALQCPPDSVAIVPHTPHGACCPTVPTSCTCNFEVCNNDCPKIKRKILVWKTDGVPGRCCDRFLCLL
ncbi:cysteine-rich motor neuron 1 protein-like [Mixophyes fleayi]|uniref:cysteine-rich motor neuron 1 protein-like n=1 Tax=Mixophyes fleayi TaxID=3061075 RepID=UPI003F4DF737